MDFAQQVKATADIVTIVGAHVRLRKSGADRYIGLCPFHSEKTPSFSVNGSLQIFKCFGCGKGGDVFNFLMELQGLSFFEALKSLAEQHGLEMPRSGKGPGADADSRKREALLRLHDVAQSFYVEQLRSQPGAEALRYLRKRGFEQEELQEYGLGYAPSGNALLRHLRNRGFKRGEVRESGLIAERENGAPYDRFWDRVMFPIHADSGKLIAFGGRGLQADRQPKYLNSPETPIYRKNAVLYNLHRARTTMRQSNLAVLVEGYMDVIGVWRAGIRNVVATCGTALTAQQIRVMRRHSDTVVVNFDSDPAGQDAAERSVELLLREGLGVKVLELPDGMDPDEYCRARGADAYRSQLERAPRYFLWLLDRSRKRFDLATSEGRVAAFESLLKSVLLLPDEIQRAMTVTELADHIGLQPSAALNRLQQASQRSERSEGGSPTQVVSLSPGERLLLLLFLHSPDARADLLEKACRIAERGLPSRRILAAMQAAVQSGEPFQYAAVEGRLEEADRQRLTRLVFDKDRPVPTLEEGRQALDALRRQVLQERYREVRRGIAEAERASASDKLAELLQRKMELERELGMVGKRGG